MKTGFLLTGILAVMALIAMAFTTPQQHKAWPVPDNYKSMKNPVTYDKSVAASLWSTHCKSCHGKEGLGDGSKAAQLDTHPGDFSTEEFQKQSEGAMFYKTKFGRDEMPSFEKKIPDDEDLWQLVHYMRAMGE